MLCHAVLNLPRLSDADPLPGVSEGAQAGDTQNISQFSKPSMG